MPSMHGPTGPPLTDADTALRDVDELTAFGVQMVVLVTTEDLRACPACRAAAGSIGRIAGASFPPIPGCSGICTCRLAPLFLE